MTAELTPEGLAELRRLAEAATPGPWVSGDPRFGLGNAQCIVSISDRAMGRDIQGPTLRPAQFDVEYIAAANPAVVLALLDAADERDALAAKVEAVREWIDLLIVAAVNDLPALLDARAPHRGSRTLAIAGIVGCLLTAQDALDFGEPA